MFGDGNGGDSGDGGGISAWGDGEMVSLWETVGGA